MIDDNDNDMSPWKIINGVKEIREKKKKDRKNKNEIKFLFKSLGYIKGKQINKKTGKLTKVVQDKIGGKRKTKNKTKNKKRRRLNRTKRVSHK